MSFTQHSASVCPAGDLNNLSPGAHTRASSLHSLHLPLVLDTSWDACSKHLELGCSGTGRVSGPGPYSWIRHPAKESTKGMFPEVGPWLFIYLSDTSILHHGFKIFSAFLHSRAWSSTAGEWNFIAQHRANFCAGLFLLTSYSNGPESQGSVLILAQWWLFFLKNFIYCLKFSGDYSLSAVPLGLSITQQRKMLLHKPFIISNILFRQNISESFQHSQPLT